MVFGCTTLRGRALLFADPHHSHPVFAQRPTGGMDAIGARGTAQVQTRPPRPPVERRPRSGQWNDRCSMHAEHSSKVGLREKRKLVLIIETLHHVILKLDAMPPYLEIARTSHNICISQVQKDFVPSNGHMMHPTVSIFMGFSGFDPSTVYLYVYLLFSDMVGSVELTGESSVLASSDMRAKHRRSERRSISLDFPGTGWPPRGTGK